ncbi:MAG TPA: response regulator transcription factor [Firmicutes bacterium]|nr:response regulator transcription factor [Bacillota bacterium]
MHGRILVVDDEPNVLELVSVYLNREGFAVTTAEDGRKALELFDSVHPDLVILDLMLPELDGWEVCRYIRTAGQTPIIMLTARNEDLDRIVGLEMGADDYVPKPFNPRELVARVKAVLRRTRIMPADENQEILRFPYLEIDKLRHAARLKDAEIPLTPKEFDLLWLLASHPGRTYTREELLEHVWGYDYFGDDRTIDVHIKRLRKKLEPEELPYRYIHTVWGVGYRFEPIATAEVR